MDGKEANQILLELKKVIYSLSRLENRLENCLTLYKPPELDDNEEFFSAEEEIADNVKSVSKADSTIKQESKKKVEYIKENHLNNLQHKMKRKRKVSRSKSLTYEAINQTVVNNIEEEMKNQSELNCSRNERPTDFFNSDEEEAERIHVQDMKLKFESQSNNEKTMHTKNKSVEGVRGNVKDIKKKFEREDVDLSNNNNSKSESNSTKIEKSKTRSKIEDEKVKKVLKYLGPPQAQ